MLKNPKTKLFKKHKNPTEKAINETKKIKTNQRVMKQKTMIKYNK
jgi:hypothetical protein